MPVDRKTSRKAPTRKRVAREQARHARQAAYQTLVLEAADAAFARQGVPQTKMEDLAEAGGDRSQLGALNPVGKLNPRQPFNDQLPGIENRHLVFEGGNDLGEAGS